VFIESTGLDSNGCNPSDPERACVSATLNFGRIEILLQGALHDWEAEPFSEFCSFFGEQAYLLKSEGRVLPGPQVRGTGGTLIVVWKGHWDRGHPHRGLERALGPGAPSAWSGKGTGTVGTLIVVWKGHWGRGHPQRGLERALGPGAPSVVNLLSSGTGRNYGSRAGQEPRRPLCHRRRICRGIGYVPELLDLNVSFGEHGLDLELVAHCLNKAAQCGEVHMLAFLHLRHRSLISPKDTGQVGLG